MARKNIKKVFEAFVARKPAIGDSKRTCSTDGETLFSYAMPIAKRGLDGTIYLVHQKSGPSLTTRSQISAVSYLLMLHNDIADSQIVRVEKIPKE